MDKPAGADLNRSNIRGNQPHGRMPANEDANEHEYTTNKNRDAQTTIANSGIAKQRLMVND